MIALSLSAPSTRAPRAPFATGSAPAYRLLAAMVALVATLVATLGFDVDRTDLPTMIAAQLFLIGVAMVLRLRGLRGVATAVESMVLVLAAMMATACLSVLFATNAFPYRDGLLDAADKRLLPFLPWHAMFVLVHRHDAIVRAMCGVYQTLFWQPFALVAILALTGQEPRCWRFVHAWFLALAGCVVVFAFVPAAGAYIHYGLVPGDIPALSVDTAWRQFAVLEQIRSGALRSLAPNSMTGLIAFPSFHAASATMLAWGFRRVRWIGMPFVALNIAMAATAPLVGAHYFVDIVAGIVVAAVAIRVTGSAGGGPRAA